MREWTPQTDDARRYLQILFISQVILFWEALKSLLLGITFWRMGVDFGSQLENMLFCGFGGLLALWISRSARRSTREPTSQNS